MADKKKSLWHDFKEFAFKGNVMDMAIGIVVGGAFGKIANSLVTDIIMPPLGLAIGGVDFTELKIVLKAATAEAEAVAINWGSFVQVIIQFIVIAICMFLVIRGINAADKKINAKKIAEKEAADAAAKAKAEAEKKPTAEELLTSILDVIKEK
ncbi:MAG: large-conductance mechanosensitive channel protein MscL [Clostridiales bacterium]|nr:large-conductance mechanosensitive channel protein MscL [Clostridiales bacterium]